MYANPQPDHSVNTSNEHPLKEFFQLLIGIAIIVVALVVLISWAAEPLARKIPFQFEREMAQQFDIAQVTPSARQNYLQALADKITPLMNLPEGMQITVHYSEEPVINAFATLGGHVVIFQGLLDKLQSEDELAAVMTHEIAHIKHRHPVVALGKGVSVAILIAAVSGASSSAASDWLIGSSANLGLMKYSRDQERQADADIVPVLHQLYGHIGGGKALFDTFAKLGQEQTSNAINQGVIELFRSHPYSQDRWQRLAEQAKTRTISKSGKLTEATWPAASTACKPLQ